MNRFKKEKIAVADFSRILYAVLVALVITGCVKSKKLYSPEEGTIYMASAYQDRAVMTLYKVDSIQNIAFGAYYAGFGAPSSDITVNFEIDRSLIPQFNIDKAYLGNVYTALPDSVYSIVSKTTVIKAGKKSSDPLFIAVDGKKISFGQRYLLPIKITSTSGGTLNPSLSVAYFRLDTLLTRLRNLAPPPSGTLTVSQENGGGPDAGEGSKKFTDDNFTTKYLSSFVPGQWMQVQLQKAAVLDAYAITSGNDAPGRDPRNWVFMGSNDGTNWTTLDTQKDFIFLGRQQTIRFDLKNPAAYSYYRLRIDATGGDNLFRATEWQLIQFY